MLLPGQTLRHKETNKLVRLVPKNDGTVWYQPTEGGALFYREDGTTFVGSPKDYTHIEDEFGRSLCGRIKEGNFVDTNLKKYLVSKEELTKMREKRLEEWVNEILTELRTNGYILCPFADGSFCIQVEKYFLKKYNAKPMYLSYNNIHKEFNTLQCRLYLMKIDDKVWLYDSQLSHITATSLEYLKEVIKGVE